MRLETDVADTLRHVPSLASVPAASADSCKAPSLTAANLQTNPCPAWPLRRTGPAGDGPETSMTSPTLPGVRDGVVGASAFTAASPQFVTFNETVKVSPSGMLAGIDSVAVSAAGVCTMVDADAAGAATELPSVASTPSAPTLNVTPPEALPAWGSTKTWLMWPGMVAAGGAAGPLAVTRPEPVRAATEGATPVAAESPELEITTLTSNPSPTLTAPGTLTAAERAARVCTVTMAGDEVPALRLWPLLASVPAALPENVKVVGDEPR